MDTFNIQKIKLQLTKSLSLLSCFRAARMATKQMRM